ncbi:transcriptional regulator [Paenibacillus nanensis]|uniref:GTP cyclohydrolase 1 type 2 homolog n=1 Tax=Paenibacillus nanensis TaxID=393251 RepID=A0A3A1USD2_9BACL|nr:Nif3-like dinuclear metal center hexameric protein [Paenibacillus nanensis]RIX51438.1 transcriptional regulator [Paenibacillus nanensis]
MSLKIKDIIQALIEPVGLLEQTVDTLKTGESDTEVTGVVMTFMPTMRVLEEARALGANLVIAHEGLYYSHHDSFGASLSEDPVYLAKQAYIRDSGLAVFRCHDYCHRYQPDTITEGLVRALGWEEHVLEREPAYSVVDIPPRSLSELAEHAKARLGAAYIRTAGNAESMCRRIGVLVGYRGGGSLAIPLFEKHQLDLIVYGEGPEWELPEYVRDAVHLGHAKGLLALGHAESEQAGMKLLADRLKQRFPQIAVHFLPNEPVFRIL